MRGGIESAHPCSTADRQARRQPSAGRQHIRHQFSGELNSCGRDVRVGRGSSEQLLAAGSTRGRLMPSRSDAGRAARACERLLFCCRVCEMRQQTTDDKHLSAERLNDRRRNRHRRHFDEQRERARRRPAVAGLAEPGLNRPRRRSRPGGPHGGRPRGQRRYSAAIASRPMAAIHTGQPSLVGMARSRRCCSHTALPVGAGGGAAGPHVCMGHG